MWQQIYIFFVDFYIYLISACCHVSIFRLIFRITTKCYNVSFHCFDSAIDTLFTLGMSPDFHIRRGIVYLSQKCYITKQKQNSLSLSCVVCFALETWAKFSWFYYPLFYAAETTLYLCLYICRLIVDCRLVPIWKWFNPSVLWL